MARQPNDPPAEPALFDHVQREKKLSDKVADLMLERILSSHLQVGDRLPSERELGEQFGVSRTVIREAVRALLAKGVLEVRAGSGLRVAAVGAATVSESMNLYVRGATLDFEHVHEVRRMLETHVAALAAERATDADVEQLESVHAEMETAVETDVETAALVDVEFHRSIARATHNELYLVLLDAIGQSQIELRRSNLGQGGSGPLTITHHLAILTAIRERDPDQAREAMQTHLDHVERISAQVAGSSVATSTATGTEAP
jgi:GntR family transcriptional repressor for pyruvate dehydrogenase complex